MTVLRDMTAPPPDMTPLPPVGPPGYLSVRDQSLVLGKPNAPAPKRRTPPGAFDRRYLAGWRVRQRPCRYDGVDGVTHAVTDGFEYATPPGDARPARCGWSASPAPSGSGTAAPWRNRPAPPPAPSARCGATAAARLGGRRCRHHHPATMAPPGGAAPAAPPIPWYGIWGAATLIWAVRPRHRLLLLRLAVDPGAEFSGAPTAIGISGTSKNDIWAVMSGSGQPVGKLRRHDGAAR